MPKYIKFLKEILSNKRKLEDLGLMRLNEECSAILQNKLPVKRRDLGSFIIPYIIGDLPINDALADLGAIINLVPSSLFEKLGLSEPKPTRMSIQLACKNVKYPRGIVEDVLVKVDKDVIDVCDEIITFDLSTSMRHLLGHDDTVYSMDVLDDIVESQLQEILLDDPSRVALQAKDAKELSNEDVLEQLTCLLASEPSRSADHFVDNDRSTMQKLRPSLEEPRTLELKELPKHLAYAYLDEAEKLPGVHCS
ncbi:uncharacterized protein LOC125371216 [Ricinus communis]|uniref:uncharacterized protein LOC125371216 n=1 Tax=Ricinus communis TaxID=3988 RepID=UPI00201A4D95|nr:uncharacterized protein LOC125371216 [Ricinus communis]